MTEGVNEMSANLLEALRVTLFGMLGIFAVMIVIYLVIAVLNKVNQVRRRTIAGPFEALAGAFLRREGGWALRTLIRRLVGRHLPQGGRRGMRQGAP